MRSLYRLWSIAIVVPVPSLLRLPLLKSLCSHRIKSSFGASGSCGHSRVFESWDLVYFSIRELLPTQLTDISFVISAWQAVSLLFFYTPVKRGLVVMRASLTISGLGMPASSIGTALAFNGVWAVTCQLLFLKRIRHRFGVILSYQLLNAGWILAWPFVPLLHKVLLATESPQSDGTYSNQRGRWLWLALAAQLGFTTFIGMASSLQMVIVNTAAPDRNSLGAVNGLSTSVGVSTQSNAADSKVYGSRARSSDHLCIIRNLHRHSSPTRSPLVDRHDVHQRSLNSSQSASSRR